MKKNKDILIDNIISLLMQSSGALKLLDISKILGFKSNTKSYGELINILSMLVEQGVVNKSSRRRYSISRPIFNDEIVGIIRINGHKNYIVTEDSNIPVVFISDSDLNTAMSGDKVCVRVLKSNKKGKNKLSGEVIKVIERNITDLIGVIKLGCRDHMSSDSYYLVPDNKKIKTDFLILNKDIQDAKLGDKVKAKIVWDKCNNVHVAKVISVFGNRKDAITHYNLIINEFKLPITFPKRVITEANSFKIPQNRSIKNRLDLRKERIITIDPETAKDFDDALSLTKLKNGNYELGIHIADVSYYVKEGSELDKEAYKRGNSIYLVDRVIPMLPESLSNEICSLNPSSIRYAFSIILEISKDLKIVNYVIAPSIIKSCRRFTYSEVQEIIDTGKGDEKKLVLELHNLAKEFRQERIKNGSINYDTKEVKYILDDNLYPVGVELKQTTDSTALVEEFMLLANKQVAKHLKKISKQYNFNALLPFIYRIHDKPNENAFSEAFEQLKSLGIKFKIANNISETLNNILSQVKDTPENTFVNQILIRSMPRALYSAINIGHFGLGFDDYTHFTSPIRRYSDLIVHRLLKEYSDGIPTNKRINQLRRNVVNIAERTSNTERDAMDVERASNKLASVIYAKTLVGSVFEGTISGVQPYGIYVTLNDIHIEGLLNRRNMPSDNYEYNERKLQLKSKNGKEKYTLGKQLKVRIVKVSISKRQIDLMIEE